jgi:hypothetical protein
VSGDNLTTATAPAINVPTATIIVAINAAMTLSAIPSWHMATTDDRQTDWPPPQRPPATVTRLRAKNYVGDWRASSTVTGFAGD